MDKSAYILKMRKEMKNLTFANDFMFGKVMKNRRICKGVLERLLKTKIDHIEYHQLEKQIHPVYDSKGIRMDVYVADSDRVFDVECQSYKEANLGKRARYYQSAIDIDTLEKGNEYTKLKECYVLFICLNDPFEKGLPVYTFDRICREDTTLDLHDFSHHVIFNCEAAEKETNLELKAFLNYMKTNKAESDFTREVDKMVQTNKRIKSFFNEYMMCRLHDFDMERLGREEGRKEGREEGIEIGTQRGKQETALSLKKLGVSADIITKATGLSETEISSFTME